ncbi:GNAT family N-acetyltransferase [Sorangium sp. So ce887]|uniref:GNAT family N-acetyltransferase n=1 Tax=Sorangium sp. So ce887 TaxID=3133324 RepID=UPI003F610D3F
MSSTKLAVNITLRPARMEDIAEIQRVGLAADERFAAAGHPELADGSIIPTQTAERAISQGRITVAEIGGAIVGWAYTGRIDGELCLGQISVEPSFGRRGIGSALLGAVIDQARSRGERSIVLNTQSDVAWNRPWYERHGFAVIARDQWTSALEALAAQQSEGGLDWSTRVHMRLVLA